jgi:RNA polymerase sigma factor (sigma-70 family)
MDLENQDPTGNYRIPAEHAGYDWESIHSRIVAFFAHRWRMDADDLAQETMVRVLKRLGEGQVINGPDGFVKFVHGCARNVLHEHRRERERSQMEVAVDETESNVPWRREGSPENLLAMREALSKLTEEERTCLFRAEVESGEKVAKEMGIHLRTLRVRVFRARRRLEALLNEPRAPATREIFPAAAP